MSEGEMAERVLSADELREAFMMGCESGRGARADVPPFTFTRLRAVEAAVIAKMEKRLVCDWGKPCISIERAEREARKRERKAFMEACARWGVAGNPSAAELCDRRYPLPTCDKCGHELP